MPTGFKLKFLFVFLSISSTMFLPIFRKIYLTVSANHIYFSRPPLSSHRLLACDGSRWPCASADNQLVGSTLDLMAAFTWPCEPDYLWSCSRKVLRFTVIWPVKQFLHMDNSFWNVSYSMQIIRQITGIHKFWVHHLCIINLRSLRNVVKHPWIRNLLQSDIWHIPGWSMANVTVSQFQ